MVPGWFELEQDDASILREGGGSLKAGLMIRWSCKGFQDHLKGCLTGEAFPWLSQKGILGTGDYFPFWRPRSGTMTKDKVSGAKTTKGLVRPPSPKAC